MRTEQPEKKLRWFDSYGEWFEAYYYYYYYCLFVVHFSPSLSISRSPALPRIPFLFHFLALFISFSLSTIIKSYLGSISHIRCQTLRLNVHILIIMYCKRFVHSDTGIEIPLEYSRRFRALFMYKCHALRLIYRIVLYSNCTLYIFLKYVYGQNKSTYVHAMYTRMK